MFSIHTKWKVTTEKNRGASQFIFPLPWRLCEVATCIAIVICDCILDKLSNMCRFAVDRSQGQLVELKLAGLNVDQFLSYVVHPQRYNSFIRYLKLKSVFCSHCFFSNILLFWQIKSAAMSHDSPNFDPRSTPLTVLVVKLPQLEELHLFIKPWVGPKDFWNHWHCLPKLEIIYTSQLFLQERYINFCRILYSHRINHA